MLLVIYDIQNLAFERRQTARFWWESPKKRYHSEDRGVDGRMGSE
jgi:hypothetical protein